MAASGPGGEGRGGGRGGVAGALGGRREVRRRGAAVQKTVTMAVDVPVLFDKFPLSCEFVLDVPQLQFVFRGWHFLVATQRQVSTVHTPRSSAALGAVAMPVVVLR